MLGGKQQLTAEADRSLECSCKLRSHLYDHVLAFLQLLLTLLQRFVDEVCHPCSVDGVDDIADPLLVKVVPSTLVRKVLEYVWLISCISEEVLNSQPFNLRNDCNFHC